MSSTNQSTATAPARTAIQERPYALSGDFDPDEKRLLEIGDVYWSHRHDAAFRVLQHDGWGLQREWLSTPVIGGGEGSKERLPDDMRGWYTEHEPIELLATHIPSKSAVWFLTESQEPPALPEDAPSTTEPLSFHRIRTRREVNQFLEHPLVGHQRGGVVGWKACFGARYRGDLVAIAILSRPSARHADDGATVELSRFASHPLRPPNTGSWVLAKARDWAQLEGFESLISYAGVAGNDGILYQALGLDAENSTTIANGQGWGNRADRDSWGDYERRKYAQRLRDTPATYDREQTTERAPAQQVGIQSYSESNSEGPHPIKHLSISRYDNKSGLNQFFERHSSIPLAIDTSTPSNVVFTVEHQAKPLAVCIVDGPTHVRLPDESANGQPAYQSIAYAHNTTSLTAPANTGAWLLAKIRKWSCLEGNYPLVGRPNTADHRAVLKRCNVPIMATQMEIQNSVNS